MHVRNLACNLVYVKNSLARFYTWNLFTKIQGGKAFIASDTYKNFIIFSLRNRTLSSLFAYCASQLQFDILDEHPICPASDFTEIHNVNRTYCVQKFRLTRREVGV